MQLKDLLIRYRNDHALTQEQIGEKIGINRCLYCRLENGETKIGNRTIQKIAKFLKMQPQQIVDLLKGDNL